MRSRAPLLLIVLLITSSFVGCASAPQYSFQFERIHGHKIRIRRPEGVPANPKAGPGGVDYVSSVKLDEKLGCEETSSLFKDIALEELQRCVNLIKEHTKVRYVLARELEPLLVLDEDNAPSCLRVTLPKIPVPREIVFQADTLNGQSCFVSRLFVESGEIMDTQIIESGIEVQLHFPLPDFDRPQNDEQTQRFLAGIALTPFVEKDVNDMKTKLNAKPLANALCQACFGGTRESVSFREPPPKPPYWPTEPEPDFTEDMSGEVFPTDDLTDDLEAD